MEPPGLIPWRPPENDDTNAEFYDCEIGGKEDTLEFEYNTDEEYSTIIKLLRERNALLLKLHELDPYQRVLSPKKTNAPKLSMGREAKTNEYAEQMANCSKRDTGYVDKSRGAIETSKNFYLNQEDYLWMAKNSSSYNENEDCSDLGEDKQYFGDIEELITALCQSNQELLNEVNYLQKEEQSIGVNDNLLEGFEDLRGQIGELIIKNKKLEEGLRTKDPLQETLGKQLDYFMKRNLSKTEISELEKSASMENMPNGHRDAGDEIKTDSGTQTDLNFLQNDLQITGKTQNSENTQFQEKKSEGVNSDMVNGQRGEEMVLKSDYEALEKELKDVKLQLECVTEEKTKMRENLDYLTDHYSKQDSIQRMHIEKIEQENKQYYNMLIEYQSGEHGRNRDYDTVLMQAERERTEKFASMAEQKVLRQQIENLSKTMKSMQIKNEELVRMQCSQEDQVDDFKRLKQLFQENGLPTIEQIIALQRQNEGLREDFLNERKEKERLLSIKDKLRRDLDSMQSRISSLQEQVYKYREHIFFLQQRTGKDGSTSPVPPSPLLENAPPSPLPTSHPPSFHNPARLYGSNAPQYINESLLEGSVPPRFPLYAVSETGKKGPPGKQGIEGQVQGQVPGKQWQYQQQNNFPGKLGRHLSLEGPEWKRGNSQQSWSSTTDSIFNSPSAPRHNSSNSYSSVRSGSSLSGSSEEGIDGMDKPNQYGRRHSARNGDEFKQLQNFGPTPSQYEGWPRQNSAGRGMRMNQNPQRNPRRYSSPVGNGVRSPSDYWSQPVHASKQWQTSLEQSQFQDSAPPGLRQCSDPWQQPLSTTLPNNSQASSVAVTSSHGDSGTYMSSGFGTR